MGFNPAFKGLNSDKNKGTVRGNVRKLHFLSVIGFNMKQDVFPVTYGHRSKK